MVTTALRFPVLAYAVVPNRRRHHCPDVLHMSCFFGHFPSINSSFTSLTSAYRRLTLPDAALSLALPPQSRPMVILVSNTLFAPQSVATNTSSSSALESSEAPRSNGMRSRLLPEADARSLAYRNSSTLHWSRPFLRRRPQDKLNHHEPP